MKRELGKKIGTKGISLITMLILLSLYASSFFSPHQVFAEEKIKWINDDMFAVYFIDDKEGWIVGTSKGIIYHSLDGGMNWEKQEIKTRLPLFSISFCNPQVGWAVGKSGSIYHSVDGGKTWKEQASPKKKHLFTVKAISPEKCWAAGDWGTIIYTSDGGKTWEDKSYSQDLIIYGIDFQGENEGWMAGEFGTILHTIDGGRNWSLQRTGMEVGAEATLFGISFASRQYGVAVGLSNTILRTDNGGSTWQKAVNVTDDQKEEIRSLYKVKLRGNFGIAVGDAGSIITTTDYGKTWSHIPVSLDTKLAWFSGVDILANDKAFIIGMSSISLIVEHNQIKRMGSLPALSPFNMTAGK